tara:strand:- start:114 stop:287 length:174 start_codon:yes stop_codon:yes gene_type:complete
MNFKFHFFEKLGVYIREVDGIKVALFFTPEKIFENCENFWDIICIKKDIICIKKDNF